MEVALGVKGAVSIKPKKKRIGLKSSKMNLIKCLNPLYNQKHHSLIGKTVIYKEKQHLILRHKDYTYPKYGVYVVESKGLIKIGYSITDLPKRAHQICNMSPETSKHVCSILLSYKDAWDWEAELHSYFHPYLLGKEWFNIPWHVAKKSIVSQYCLPFTL